jgi:hypothetical protein
LLRSETKRSEIQVYFFAFFCFFFTFFRFLSLNFCFTSIFSLTFRLFYLHFRFRFLVFRIEVNHVKSGFFFASKRNEIFTSISNFASEAKVRAHPNPDPTFHFAADPDKTFHFDADPDIAPHLVRVHRLANPQQLYFKPPRLQSVKGPLWLHFEPS